MARGPTAATLRKRMEAMKLQLAEKEAAEVAEKRRRQLENKAVFLLGGWLLRVRPQLPDSMTPLLEKARAEGRASDHEAWDLICTALGVAVPPGSASTAGSTAAGDGAAADAAADMPKHEPRSSTPLFDDPLQGASA